MIIVDAHEDLAWSMLTFGRDLTLPAAETRRREAGTPNPAQGGDTLLGWADYQQGQVAVVFATLFATPTRHSPDSWDILKYKDAEEARSLYRAQADLYHKLVDEYPDKFHLVLNRPDLEKVLEAWQSPSGGKYPDQDGRPEDMEAGGSPVGLVILMEGAEGVRNLDELVEWWQLGVRLIGLAWAGNDYCGGTREPGPLTREGYALLEAMADLGFGLDLSHMDEKAALQALDSYPTTILATHANALALLKGSDNNRHLSDRVIRGLLEREGVIGVVPYNPFLVVGWKTGDKRESVSLHHLVAQIDYICQMSGDARHVGLGSDFDGGFGLQSTPAEIDTIADLQKLVPLLQERGYSEADIAGILGENWITVLRRSLPEVG